MVIITTSPVITIDGPSGVGKSTLSKFLKNKLQWNILDSGLIYRALAFFILHDKININNVDSISSLIYDIENNFKSIKEILKIKIYMDMNFNIYNEEIGAIASKIATFPYIRKLLLKYQRSFLSSPGLIAEGRDMGVVVFPYAKIKIFLYASIKKRVYRRTQQLQKNGLNVNLNDIFLKIRERDFRDQNRRIAPLVPAIDAFCIDSTNLNIDEVLDLSLKYIKKKL